MVNPIFSPMIIAAKIHKYFSRFENAGATSPGTSKTLQALGLHNGLIFKRLLRNGVFVEVTPGKYFVSRTTYNNFREQRKRNVFLILSGILLISLIIIIIFFFFNAQ